MEQSYRCTVYPLERAGVSLHLDCLALEGTRPERSILLTHGVTYSTHEFDIDYSDYSLARRLAREGYAVWRLDIAGYGRSGPAADGFLPDSHYAAGDIRAAVQRIVRETEQEKLDLLGWSWGTVTAARYAAAAPERIRRLVLYAPILCGIGQAEITEPIHANTWAHAAEDFQRGPDGLPDPAVTDPVVLGLFCSGCWRFDGHGSPNAGRREICVDPAQRLIELDRLRMPTLILCGDRDPYLDYGRIEAAASELPAGSLVSVIPGASHAAMLEAPYYREFQRRLTAFLNAGA